jgi:hypothetical protein
MNIKQLRDTLLLLCELLLTTSKRPLHHLLLRCANKVACAASDSCCAGSSAAAAAVSVDGRSRIAGGARAHAALSHGAWCGGSTDGTPLGGTVQAAAAGC